MVMSAPPPMTRRDAAGSTVMRVAATMLAPVEESSRVPWLTLVGPV